MSKLTTTQTRLVFNTYAIKEGGFCRWERPCSVGERIETFNGLVKSVSENSLEIFYFTRGSANRYFLMTPEEAAYYKLKYSDDMENIYGAVDTDTIDGGTSQP